MRIKLDTPAEIAKWREERKRFEQKIKYIFFEGLGEEFKFSHPTILYFLNKIYCFNWAQASPIGRAQMEPIGPVSKIPS